MNKNNKIFIFCGLTSISISFANLLISLLTKKLIDAPSIRLVICLGFVWLFIALTRLIKNYISQRYYLNEKKIHTATILKRIFSFQFAFLESKQYNDDLNQVKTAVSQEQEFVLSIENIIVAVFGLIGLYILLVGQISMQLLAILTIFLFVIIILLGFVNYKLSTLMYDYWTNYIKNTRRYNYLSDVLTNKEYIEEKKVYSYLKFFSNEFDKEFNFASKKNGALGIKRIKLELLSDSIIFIYVFLGFVILFYAYRNGQISIGLLISSTGYLMSLLGNISKAIGMIEKITRYKNNKKDLNRFLEQKNADIQLCEEKMLDDTILLIENVRFKYPTNDKIILDKVSFSFKKGRKYAIVGVNGSGKTTLAKILSGLYAPVSGSIKYDSKPVVLFQDFNKYPATLRENITMSENISWQDKNKVHDVENKAGLTKRISLMKFGDETELTTLTEFGEELSGGEWQRIALARVLWKDADIYILDEPTASLDPIEEIRIFDAYNKILETKTVIFITHRLGFVKNVDEIIVLSDGCIKEVGTHDALLKLPDGAYKKMFEEQKNWYE